MNLIEFACWSQIWEKSVAESSILANIRKDVTMAEIQPASNPEIPLPLPMPSEGRALNAELAAAAPEVPAHPYASYIYGAYVVMGLLMLWLVLSAYRERLKLKHRQAAKSERVKSERA